MIVRELITRLGFSLNQSQLNNAENGVRRVKDRAEQAATAFRNMAAAVASLASVRSIINIADEMQSLRSRIGMLPQTISDAGTAFDEVADRAIAARSSIQAYGQLYVRLAGATSDFINSQEEVLLITDAISQALVIGGANAAEAASATLQLSQAFQKGKLDGDEFRSFMESLSSDFKDKLAKELDTTKDKFFEMSSSGELTTRKLAEAFKRMAPEISKQMLTIPLTVGQATTIVVSRFSRMIDRINRESNFVTTIANAILAAFDKIEAGVDTLVEAFGGWNNMLRFIGIAIGVAFGAKALSILATFRAASLLAMLPLIKIIAIITAVALVLEDLYVWIQGGDSVIGTFIGNWEDVKYTVLGVAAAIGAVVGMFAVWKAAVIGYTLALQAYEAAIIAVAAVKRGLIVVAFALNAVMALNPIGLIVIAIGALIAAGALLIANWQTVKDWFAGLFSWFGDKFTELGKWVADLLTKAGSLFGVGGATAGAAGPGATPASTVAPAQLAPAAMGAGRPNVQSNTNVTVTVPPGTTAEQAKFLQGAAQQSFGKGANEKLARDMAVYAP